MRGRAAEELPYTIVMFNTATLPASESSAGNCANSNQHHFGPDSEGSTNRHRLWLLIALIVEAVERTMSTKSEPSFLIRWVANHLNFNTKFRPVPSNI